MDFEDVLKWEYTPTPIPAFSWEKPINQSVSPQQLTQQLEPAPLIKQFREQRPAQSTLIEQYPVQQPALLRRKGHPIFTFFLSAAIYAGIAIFLLGNPQILSWIADGFARGLNKVIGFF